MTGRLQGLTGIRETTCPAWPESLERRQAGRPGQHATCVHGSGLRVGHQALQGGSLGSDSAGPSSSQLHLLAVWGRLPQAWDADGKRAFLLMAAGTRKAILSPARGAGQPPLPSLQLFIN